jgi:hypothetical protein
VDIKYFGIGIKETDNLEKSQYIRPECRDAHIDLHFVRQALYHLSHTSSFSYFSNKISLLCLDLPGPQFSPTYTPHIARRADAYIPPYPTFIGSDGIT